jgi:hypothetical protein
MDISLFSANLKAEQIEKIIQVSKRLKINHLWLMATMYFETSRTFSTTITNKIGSVGLIQFTRDKAGDDFKTIGGKQYKLTTIKKMSFNEQMDLVELYYRPYIGKMSSFLDVYLVTFFPAAIGKSSSFVLETPKLSRSLIAAQNPIFDKNKDKKVTLNEIKTFFSGYYGKQNFDIIAGSSLSIYLLLLIPFFF